MIAQLQQNGLFLEFSLCLSRACLGKVIIFLYKWVKNTVFSPASNPSDQLPTAHTARRNRKTPLFLSAFPCSFRACLGKMMPFHHCKTGSKKIDVLPATWHILTPAVDVTAGASLLVDEGDQAGRRGQEERPAEANASISLFWALSLCLSRAWLGKACVKS